MSCVGDTVTVYGSGFCHINGELSVVMNGNLIASYNDFSNPGYSLGNYVSHSFNHFSFVAVSDSGFLEILSYSGGNSEISNSIGYQNPLLGCTDVTAFNYNSNAICDDGSCISFV